MGRGSASTRGGGAIGQPSATASSSTERADLRANRPSASAQLSAPTSERSSPHACRHRYGTSGIPSCPACAHPPPHPVSTSNASIAR
ncbi:hypothetical protein ACFQQB_36535 [Nonomuraea rubra]|uniref:hypothetical protein n=1 Tax=Nonomuraea rubra TaxID=46180 RepID=UPI003621FF04